MNRWCWGSRTLFTVVVFIKTKNVTTTNFVTVTISKIGKIYQNKIVGTTYLIAVKVEIALISKLLPKYNNRIHFKFLNYVIFWIKKKIYRNVVMIIFYRSIVFNMSTFYNENRWSSESVSGYDDQRKNSCRQIGARYFVISVAARHIIQA